MARVQVEFCARCSEQLLPEEVERGGAVLLCDICEYDASQSDEGWGEYPPLLDGAYY